MFKAKGTKESCRSVQGAPFDRLRITLVLDEVVS